MGKRAKKLASDKRKIEKRKRKAANQAKYAAWRDAGTNTKSKRFTLNKLRSHISPTKHLHITVMCGNAGCRRCFPRS